jgi:succinate-semialdehyde dehydrogenase/glutarate-semialdehyde dehydrogenase
MAGNADSGVSSYEAMTLPLAGWPYHQVFRMVVPALMAGNAAIVKHASNVPGCAGAIEEIFHGAGIPEDLLRVLVIASRHVDGVIANPLVRGVSLTGSGPAGEAVARAAAPS